MGELSNLCFLCQSFTHTLNDLSKRKILLQIEQVSQMSALVEAQLDYHKQAVQILDELSDKLKER